MVGNASRAAITSDRRITGLSADVIAELVAYVGPLWHERHQAKLVSKPRKRAVGAGAKHRLVFVDRALVEKAVATPKSWRLLRKLRCSIIRITNVVQAVLTLHLTSSEWVENPHGLNATSKNLLHRSEYVNAGAVSANLPAI